MKNKWILRLSLAAVMAALCAQPAFAEEAMGPGYSSDGQALPPATGPGAEIQGEVQGPAQGTFVDGPEVGDAFIQMEVENPVVQPVEKYSYDQMENDLHALQAKYGSGRMQIRTIGTSIDGRALYEVTVGNPNAEKHVLIQAGIHARESMTPMLVMKQIEYALHYYNTGSYHGRRLSDMLNQVAIHFVPMSNPDGTSISQFGLEGIRSEELRQAISACYASDVAAGRTTYSFETYLRRWKANARGVDLNRNFDASWAAIQSETVPFSFAGCKGPAPLSEPESAALAALGNSRYWSATVSYHSMGEVIYWNGAGNRMAEPSRVLADNVAVLNGYRIISENGQGGFKDWMQCKDTPSASVTIEVGRESAPLPLSQFPTVWAQNKCVWAQVVEFVLNSGL